MNLHLSVFRPYQRDAGHEDQLTRAALIVMKLVPLAHEALLGSIGAERLSALPAPRFDMQTERLVPGDEAEERHVTEFVSVFLGPHEDIEETASGLDLHSERRARYDGVIQYGPQLLVVIESKLFASSDDSQSLQINTSGMTADQSRRVPVRWHELLDRWWNLTELGMLNPAEAEVLADFFDFAEENFSDLLPFTDLERCGDNPRRRHRRLRTVLETATRLPTQTAGERVQVKFPEEGVVSVQRATLWSDGISLRLAMWPAELVPQYKHLYGTPERVESLIHLGQGDGWSLEPNFHIGYWRSAPRNRWYATRALAGPEYLWQWTEDLDDAGRRPREEIEDPRFWRWLLDRGYATADDRGDLDRLLEVRMDKFDIRPSIEIMRTWDWAEAVELDRTRELAGRVREAIDQVLEALDEPSLERLLSDASY